MIPKGVLNVRSDEDPEGEEDSKEGEPRQKLEDQEVDVVEEVQPQSIDFYKKKENWVHLEQCKRGIE